MINLKNKTIFIFTFILCLAGIYAANPHGTTLARGKNVHSGNKVRTTFYNYGLLGRWMSEPDDIGGEWPINSTHEYIGDVGVLVGSEIIDNDGQTQQSVTTTYSPRGSEMNLDDHWGWEPLMGYFNDDSNLVAMSHMGPPVDPSNPTHPNTWPDQWPDKMSDIIDPGWAGKWNGYFGKDQKNAEQESYFIMDDANDEEFNFFPDSTDLERKGLGLNATVRGLQWNHIMAEDVLFWLYDVKNIGQKNHNKMVFGTIVGTITGGDGDSQDDYADFDKVDDIAYSYDHGTNLETGLGGVGAGGWSPVGLAGYAFLESPGNSIDGIDNDGDGSNGSGNIITEEMFEPVAYATGDSVVVIDYNTYERSITEMPNDSLIVPFFGGYYGDNSGHLLIQIWQKGNESEDIYGCTDSEAKNYNPDATVDDGSCDVLIEDITLVATQYQNLESSVLLKNTEYYLKVSGIYGISEEPDYECIDGAFIFCDTVNIQPHRIWTWNDSTTQRPTPDIYNEEHIYYFDFLGDSTSEEFGFEDSSGNYSDNSGHLLIQIWQKGNESEDIYGCTDSEAKNYNPDATVDDGSCDVLIEDITLMVTRYQNLESSVLLEDTEYYLKVAGTYGIKGDLGQDCRDGAFTFCDTANIQPHRIWTWNDSTTQRPTPDMYNEEHIYYFDFLGDGTSENFGFVMGGLIFKPGVAYEEIERNLIDDNLNGIIDENNGYSIDIADGFFVDIYLNVGLKSVDYFTDEGLDNLLIDESRSDGIDNDGDWDIETDDVGRDGAPGSGDTFYGESDGQPTSGFELIGDEWIDTGFPGEPNIDKTDIDESDQIGLSSFYYFAFGQFSNMGCDNCLWNKLAPGYFNKSVQNVDADFLFGSGYFPLQTGETERFSIAMLFGDNLPDLIRNKQTVQTIYNQNYNFAKAPELPTVWAYEGDGYVTVYWDDKAERSFDRLSGYDFEGYKIYKATDTEFTDAGAITDAFGSHKFNIPEKQFDLVNEHEGFFPIDIDGVLYNLGENTGLVHAWTDTNVLNGHRYYYAVTAYDHGNLEKEILPAETSKFVTIDKSGKIQTAQNVISVIPEAHAAGYIIPPENEDVYPIHDPRGTGRITLQNLDPAKIPANHNYRIYFLDSRLNGLDDDGDWVHVDDNYANNQWDSTEVYYDFGFDGVPNTDDTGEGNGSCDWLDYGTDGTRNQDEPGFNPYANPDPNHDNYIVSGPNGNCQDGWDNDGDGEVDEMVNGECDDWGTENDGRYQVGETGEPFIDGNASFDKDVGTDGCRDEFEDGLGGCFAEQNPAWNEGLDPNGDNYNIISNPSGTEGNQQPDLGEPDVDSNDIEEMIPVTSHFMVVDITEPSSLDTVVTWTQALDEDKTIFKGMQLLFDNHTNIRRRSIQYSPEYDQTYTVLADSFSYGGVATVGIKYPRDMKFIFSDSADFQTDPVTLFRTSGDTIVFESANVNYSIVDPYDNSPISFGVLDQTYEYTIPASEFDSTEHEYHKLIEEITGYYDQEGFHEHPDSTLYYVLKFAKPGHFSFSDRIIITELLADTTIVTWNVSPISDDIDPNLHMPTAGDTLFIDVFKPFTSEDAFGFVSNAPYIDKQSMKDDIRSVKVVPNPYIAGASWEGQNPYATGRGPRSLHFTHLPARCKITIFNLAGEMIDVVTHDTVIEDGTAEWDMLTKENLSISYGVYLYYVESLPGAEYEFEPIYGKFAVIK